MRAFTNCRICNIDLDLVGAHFKSAYCCEEHRKQGKKKFNKKIKITVDKTKYKKKEFTLPTTKKNIYKFISISATNFSNNRRMTIKHKLNHHQDDLKIKTKKMIFKKKRVDGITIRYETIGLNLNMILKIIKYHIKRYNTKYCTQDIVYIKYYIKVFKDIEKIL